MRKVEGRKWKVEAWQEAEEDRLEAILSRGPYRLRYFFDVDECLWGDNARTKKAFGYPADLQLLPISETLLQESQRLTYLWDSVLNWGSVDQTDAQAMKQWEMFKEDALQFYQDLQEELGPEFEIIDRTGY